jgi:hypothetical protein
MRYFICNSGTMRVRNISTSSRSSSPFVAEVPIARNSILIVPLSTHGGSPKACDLQCFLQDFVQFSDLMSFIKRALSRSRITALRSVCIAPYYHPIEQQVGGRIAGTIGPGQTLEQSGGSCQGTSEIWTAMCDAV